MEIEKKAWHGKWVGGTTESQFAPQRNPLWPVDLRRTLDLAGSGQAQCHGSPDTIARLRAGGQAERAVEGILQLVLQTRHVLATGDDVQPLDWTQEAGGGRHLFNEFAINST